jgi:hypothetical protein
VVDTKGVSEKNAGAGFADNRRVGLLKEHGPNSQQRPDDFVPQFFLLCPMQWEVTVTHWPVGLAWRDELSAVRVPTNAPDFPVDLVALGLVQVSTTLGGRVRGPEAVGESL